MATNQNVNYMGYNEMIFARDNKDRRLEYTVEFCRKIGISYAKFQTLEAFGKIPQPIINRLHQNLRVSDYAIWRYCKELKEAAKSNE